MKIKIEEYNINWPVLFMAEKESICKALGKLITSIDHIGSTSVHELAAKPVIDILIGLEDDSYLDKVVQPMIDSGYTYFKIYETDMPDRRLFAKLKPMTELLPPKMIDVTDDYISGLHFLPQTNIHIIVKDTPHWTRHIAFRDFLRTHPDFKEEYSKLKLRLSHEEFANHLEYNQAKDKFVKVTEQLALNWYQNQIQRTI